MAGYFSNFPSIEYNGKTIKDIMRRSTAVEKIINLGVPLQPLELRELERADYVSDALYNRPEFDYILYMVNDIIDPYYEWYLSQNQLDSFIDNKYGITRSNPKYYEYYNNYKSKNNPNKIIDLDQYKQLSAVDRQEYEKIAESVLLVTPDTYDSLSEDDKQFYFVVTNEVFERRENDKRRFVNVVAAEFSGTVNKQIRQSLNNQPLS